MRKSKPKPAAQEKAEIKARRRALAVAGQESETRVPARKRYRVFLSAEDRTKAGAEGGACDLVIAESIGYLVVVTARLFDRQLATRLRRHKVPIGQWPFLLFLWANETLSQRELSKLMAIEESTVTNTINRMVRDGIISRTRTPGNRRRNQLRLSDRGQGLLKTLLPEALGVVETATRGMSETELAFLMTLVCKVQSNLADDRAQPLGI